MFFKKSRTPTQPSEPSKSEVTITWEEMPPQVKLIPMYKLFSYIEIGQKMFCLFVVRNHVDRSIEVIPQASMTEVVIGDCKIYPFYIIRTKANRYHLKFFDGTLAGIITLRPGFWDVEGKRLNHWRDPFQRGVGIYNLADAGEMMTLPDLDKTDKDVSWFATSQGKGGTPYEVYPVRYNN